MTTTLTLTERSRTALSTEAEHLVLWAMQVRDDLRTGHVDAEETIIRLQAVIRTAKDLDFKVKTRRRAAKRVAS